MSNASQAVSDTPPSDMSAPAVSVASKAEAQHPGPATSTRGPIWAWRLAGVLVLVGGWEFAYRAGMVNPLFVGSPSGILRFLFNGLFVETYLWVDAGHTLGATLLAFTIGSSAGVLAGLLFVLYPPVEEFFEPLTAALNSLPRIALAPLFLLWFGLGLWFKVGLGASLSLFIILSATLAGARSTDLDHLVLFRTLGASRMQTFIKVVLPGAVPTIFSGLRLSLVYALLGVVTAELLASRAGLGQRVSYLGGMFDTSGVFGILLLLAVIGGGLSSAMSMIERRLLRWR
ncbi:MAG: ABC transporter permease [Ramlibacter sp.]